MLYLLTYTVYLLCIVTLVVKCLLGDNLTAVQSIIYPMDSDTEDLNAILDSLLHSPCTGKGGQK